MSARRIDVLRTCLIGSLILTAFAGGAHAQGNITFGAGIPAVSDTPAAAEAQSPARGAQKGKAADQAARIEHGPGVNRAILPPVTPEESERAIGARALPKDLNQGVPEAESMLEGETKMSAMRVAGDTAPSGPASIAELARALKNDPDLIYEYVRNNIAYYPTWGVQKGAIGALLDNQGTAFDQATLMVQLLRQAGFTANHVKGRINLTAAQV